VTVLRRLRVTAFLLLPAVVAALGPIPLAQQRARAEDSPRPSIVIINTDDQRSDWSYGLYASDPMVQEAMPQTYSRIVQQGVTFPNGFVVNPLCCPSRTALLTGTYSHTNGVWHNRRPGGGWPEFVAGGWEKNNLAVWLHDAGYRTGLFGKYLNQYDDPSHIPQGWDEWFATMDEVYFGFHASVNGVAKRYGKKRYETTVTAHRASAFVTDTPADQPLFLYWAPPAPHVPHIPETQTDLDTFSGLAAYRPASYNEANVSDKPAWVRREARIRGQAQSIDDEWRREQFATLESVDRGVGQILDALDASGRLNDTLIVFTSDNGFEWGEHRLWGKNVGYDPSVRVPFAIRYDAGDGAVPRVDPAIALEIDVAPTALDLAGTTATRPPDGQSLVRVLSGDPPTDWRSMFLVEHGDGARRYPPFCSARTDHSVFIRYATGEEEYYDYDDDPYELVNGIDDPTYRSEIQSLRRYTRHHCTPRPPGFTWRKGH
jgi:arylsulfatase A-like enzyme